MKKILLIVCAVCMLVACGGKSGSKATVDFLEKMGVNTDSLTILGDSLNISLTQPLVHLDADQTVRLCANIEPQVADEEQVEGLFSVAAAKPLDGGKSLLFLWHEFGGGGVMYACTYDADGRYADGIELGPWNYLLETPGDGIYTSEQESDGGTFSADGFTLLRSISFTQKEEGMTAKWGINKTYTYRIDDKGHITLVDVKAAQEGKVPADRLLSDDIADLARMSAADPQLLSKMETMAGRDDIRQSEDHAYELAVAVADVFEKSPAALVQWMAAHRDSPLMAYVQKAVESGAIDKARFDAELESLADAEAKTALQDLPKTWKVDAAGGIDDEDEDLGEVVSDDFVEEF